MPKVFNCEYKNVLHEDLKFALGVLQAPPFFRVSIITLLESIFPNNDSNEDRHAVSHLAGHLENNYCSETKRVNCETPELYKPNKRRRYFQYKNIRGNLCKEEEW
jgi:hypothetical protein